MPYAVRQRAREIGRCVFVRVATFSEMISAHHYPCSSQSLIITAASNSYTGSGSFFSLTEPTTLALDAVGGGCGGEVASGGSPLGGSCCCDGRSG